MMEDGGLLQRFANRAFHILLWPFGPLPALVIMKWGIPRRVPDLVRFTNSPGLRKLHGSAAAWTAQNFERIERAAPWLERVGSRVWDHCHTSSGYLAFTNIRDPRSVVCSRNVATVYSFDGDPVPRLAELSAILHACGWGGLRFDGQKRGYTVPADLRKSPVRASWWPTGDVGYPAGLQTVPPLGRPRTIPDMEIGWASRGQSAESIDFEARWSDDIQVATLWYQPVEVDDTKIGALAAEALSSHQHAVVIEIELAYYSNPNVNAGPHRLRKRLVPVR